MLKYVAVLGLLGLLSQPALSQPLTEAAAGSACSPPVGAQTGAAATIPANPIPAVPLKDYDKHNGVNPDKIQQVVPVPTPPGQVAGPTIIKAVPLNKYMESGTIRPEDVKNYVPVGPAEAAGMTGGASPICPDPNPVIIQPASPIVVPTQPMIEPAPAAPTGGAAPTSPDVRGYW